jgi:phenylacetate-CoA ligase
MIDMTPSQLRELQRNKLNRLLDEVRRRPFYAARIHGVSLPLKSLDDLKQLPLLCKSELVQESRCAPGLVFDLPRTRYTRLHQTSGTKGFPMAVLDSPQDWQWWLRCWDYVLDAAHVTEDDVAMMAFSFGPFIGFWTANDALVKRGAMVIPGGGVSSENRIRMIHDHGCTIVCCTPTYALHLQSVAEKMQVRLAESPVTRVIVAGEPGGSVPAIRQRIEQAWGATVIDHAGASEVGAWGFGSADGRGIHVIETEFIAELLHFDDRHPNGIEVNDGEEAELVLTSLGRFGGPVIRYRTGDIVRGFRQHDRPCPFLWLDGGVLGRGDDMLVIRGVNVFPSSVEAIIRELDATAEFRMIASRTDEMDQLEVEIEADSDLARHLAAILRDRLAMRVVVTPVDAGSLPRFEAKSRRLVDRRFEANP